VSAPPRYADIDPSRSVAFHQGRGPRDRDFRGTCRAHGLTALECGICVKLNGECDFGDCTDPATTRSAQQRRPMCERHQGLLARIGQ
jgi:hypothetical protein